MGYWAATRGGWLIDYLLVKCYLGEIVLWLWLFAVIMREKKELWEWSKKHWLELAGGLLVIAILMGKMAVSGAFLARGAEMGVAALASWRLRQKCGENPGWREKLTKIVSGVVVGEGLLALYQWWQQKSWLPYSILGETNLQSVSDVARGWFWGRGEMILPYGTMSHPNVLAGTVAILLWWLGRETGWRQWWSKIALVSGVSVIFLTQSLTAGAFLVLVLLAQVWGKVWQWWREKREEKDGWWRERLPEKKAKKTVLVSAGEEKAKKVAENQSWSKMKKFLAKLGVLIAQNWLFYLKMGSLAGIVLLLPWVTERAAGRWTENLSWGRRAQLNQVALQMWSQNPFLGVGLNQFTAQLEGFWPDNQFTQPAHNVFLLILAETGLVGVTIIILTLYIMDKRWQILRKTPFLVLLAWAVLLSFDHYLWTSWWGWLVFLTFI